MHANTWKESMHFLKRKIKKRQEGRGFYQNENSRLVQHPADEQFFYRGTDLNQMQNLFFQDDMEKNRAEEYRSDDVVCLQLFLPFRTDGCLLNRNGK